MIKRLIKAYLAKRGYEIRRAKPKVPHLRQANHFTMQAALGRSRKRGVEVATVIDVGASDGRWSRDCLKFFPDANYLLVEAQRGHRDGLEIFKQDVPKGDYVLAAAGAAAGTIFFDASDLFGGVASDTPAEQNSIEVPVIALDEAIESKGLAGPYLLKLDTHGYELPILEGAKNLLSKASLVIIETYNFKLTSESLRYFEICAHMESLGFSPVENVDFMLRAKDGAFWQMDSFFIPSDSQVFKSNQFK